MLADGADISGIEMAMSNAFSRGIARSMAASGLEPIEVESGGFPTVPIRMSRGYSPTLPVIALRCNTIVWMKWLKEQSREWAMQKLSESVMVMSDAIIRAARDDGAIGKVGVDRSSMRVVFEPLAEKMGFSIRFFVSLAYERIGGEGIVVETTQPEISVGTFDLGKLPEESQERLSWLMASARAVREDPELDSVLDAMMEPDAFEKFMT